MVSVNGLHAFSLYRERYFFTQEKNENILDESCIVMQLYSSIVMQRWKESLFSVRRRGHRGTPHDTQLAEAPIVIPLSPQKLSFCMSIKIY
jgi:hypothetical protein